MNGDNGIQINGQQVLTIQIIAGALIAGVTMFGLVAALIGMQKEPGDPMLGYLAVGFAVVDLFLWTVVPGLVAKSAMRMSQRESVEPPKRLSQLVTVFQTKTIVGFAMLEGAALFALVAYMVTAQWWTLATAAFLILTMVVSFPTRTRIEHWVHDQLQIINLEN